MAIRSVGAATLALQGGCASAPAPRAPDPDVRIVAFGDSTTRGPAEVDYPELLPELLDLSTEAVSNEGLAGENTGAGLRRLGALIDQAIFPNAETLLYWEGGTDVIDFVAAHGWELGFLGGSLDPHLRDELEAELDRIAENMAAVVARGLDAGWSVYVLTYYPLAMGVPCPLVPLGVLTPLDGPIFNEYREALNERIRSVAAESGAILVDVAESGETLLADLTNYHDCNHLSGAGNTLVAEFVAAAVGLPASLRAPPRRSRLCPGEAGFNPGLVEGRTGHE